MGEKPFLRSAALDPRVISVSLVGDIFIGRKFLVSRDNIGIKKSSGNYIILRERGDNWRQR